MNREEFKFVTLKLWGYMKKNKCLVGKHNFYEGKMVNNKKVKDKYKEQTMFSF